MEKLRQIGFGLAARLVIAVAVPGGAALAGAAGEPPEYAAVLQKIFASLDAEGVDIPFGGPIAAPLGIAQSAVTVRELPPVRPSSMDLVYVFNELKDGSGYIVVRFTPSEYAALRLDKNFNFIAAAIERYGQPVAALSGAAAEDLLSQELRDWQTIASRLSAPR
jgi:hypothetical protein